MCKRKLPCGFGELGTDDVSFFLLLFSLIHLRSASQGVPLETSPRWGRYTCNWFSSPDTAEKQKIRSGQLGRRTFLQSLYSPS
ncbi:hypothetical protein AOLI_G00091610 [Acnodon oligacanthus]